VSQGFDANRSSFGNALAASVGITVRMAVVVALLVRGLVKVVLRDVVRNSSAAGHTGS
jgi:hypothetical protein